ncbi:MAG: hypothetical protein JO300_05560 [Silvibacterium sp.]|nr:hypothetical protein [Silvibacterium sp.]MBV8438227.1 hypothetical protein [Silvibacterium sp.]
MFQLKSGTTTFDFGIDGSVQQAGVAAGTWTTNAKNQIILAPSGGGASATFPVDWLFNNNNQLQIISRGTPVFNFHSGAALPLYSNDKDILIVRPDSSAPFTFQLHGTWNFNPQNLLVLTLGSQVSTLDGFLQDSNSHFSYHFFDVANFATGNENVLSFPGDWKHSVVNGKSVLVLHYDTADGKGAEFTLPGTINLDPSVNEFVYSYDKGTDTFGLQFIGTLHIASDFTITYKLDDESSSSGTGATFSMDAQFIKKDFKGNLDLQLKSEANNGTTLTVGGSFTVVLGGNSLNAGFHFTQPNSGNAQAFGFNGEFKSFNGTDLRWAFEENGPSTTVSIDAENFKLGPFTGSERFTLTTDDGQVKAIKVLFGIQF